LELNFVSILADCDHLSAVNPRRKQETNIDFNDANFRLRLVMVASNSSRGFSLDWVGVRVRYTP
jgi:hypothetical protein